MPARGDSPIRVLYIEDSMFQAKVMTASLAHHNIETSHSLTIKDVESSELCMGCLLDLGLEKTQGVDTVKEFRKFYPHMPIVVVSVESSVQVLTDCLELGVHSCHLKTACTHDKIAENIAVALRDAVKHTRDSQIKTIDLAIENIRSYADLLRRDQPNLE